MDWKDTYTHRISNMVYNFKFSFVSFAAFHYRPHEDWQRDLLRNEEGIEEVAISTSDKVRKEADEKCRNQKGKAKKDEQVGNKSGRKEEEQSVNHAAGNQYLGDTAQPPMKSENN